ncbi:MAG: hypothetical protein PVG87_18995, partial [Desulfobacteraceae bacterium]
PTLQADAPELQLLPLPWVVPKAHGNIGLKLIKKGGGYSPFFLYQSKKKGGYSPFLVLLNGVNWMSPHLFPALNLLQTGFKHDIFR